MSGPTQQASDENITMLLSMGFADVSSVRKALNLANNDLNEAVAILTGEVNKGDFNSTPDIEMSDVNANNNSMVVPYGPQLENQQQQSTSTATENQEVPESIDMSIDEMPEEFPAANFYELESRVFTEKWSIPYKKDESLGRCLYSAIKLASLDKINSDENCIKFVDRVLPECIEKLTSSQDVRKWTPDIHEGIFNMFLLFIDFVAVRIKFEPVPIKILDNLAKCFDPDSEFNYKNRTRRANRALYEEHFGFNRCPAVSPQYTQYKDPFGWLVELFNRFAWKGGLDALVLRMSTLSENATPNLLATMWKPLGLCASYLNKEVLREKLSECAKVVVKFVTELKASDLKEKDVDKVYDLLCSLYALCNHLWLDKTTAVDELHLSTVLKMLSTPHYNARMNALKELCRLIKACEKEKSIKSEHILKWILENKVLSVAFSNSLHHSQYCEKLNRVVEFAGSKIGLDELSTIWRMQSGKHVTVVENIHNIFMGAAHTFTNQQIDTLIQLIGESLKEKIDEDEKTKEGLLHMVGKIGRDIRNEDTVIKFLSMLWDFWHLPNLPLILVNQAVQSHLDILTESNMLKANVKLDYVSKCVHDIKSSKRVVPALRHLLHNLQAMVKTHFAKNARTPIQEQQSQHDMLKLISKSLIQCHNHATHNCSPTDELSGDTLIDNMYTHKETVITHLKLMEFVLQEGGVYLAWNRCKDIWDCLMFDENSCEGDHETCFEWFLNCINDLTHEKQKELFATRIIKTDIDKFKETGFNCFKSYFENVNIEDHKLRKNGNSLTVEKQDLLGLQFLFNLILESPLSNIAEQASKYIINISYTLLSAKLKKSDILTVHRQFLNECNKKLDGMILRLLSIEDPGPKDGKITKTFKKPLPVNMTDRGTTLQSIERLLNLISLYIWSVEEDITLTRSFPPLASCYYGSPVTVNVNCEATKSKFTLSSHSNEKFGNVRHKIFGKVKSSTEQTCSKVENLQIYMNDQLMIDAKDHKLVRNLGVEQSVDLNVKIGATVVKGDADKEEEVSKRSDLLELEKSLPSYILAAEFKIYTKLYELAQYEEPRLTNALQSLLSQLPTDADVLNAIDIFSFQNPWLCSPGTQAGYTKSSESVLDNYFKCSAPKMSAFRVLYNLQVLSSKLMPVLDTDSAAMTCSFRENWLNAGGLSLIMSILVSGTLPPNVDYKLRQSCYCTILQLARFLLVGETYDSSGDSNTLVTPSNDAPLTPTKGCSTAGAGSSSGGGPEKGGTPINSHSTPVKGIRGGEVPSSWPGVEPHITTHHSPSGSTTEGSVRKRMRSASVLDSVSPTVKRVIENLNKHEFKETISSLIHVAWAAGAGRLNLKANTRKKSSSVLQSPLHSPNTLRVGICLQQDTVSNMDTILSNNSLELIVMCLQLRPNSLPVFYELAHVIDFIVDLLTGSPSSEVRASACLHFTNLARTTQIPNNSTAEVTQQPKLFLLSVLVNSQLPYWNTSGMVRGNSTRLLRQSCEYFELLCNLFEHLTRAEQTTIGIDVNQLLVEELAFLTNSENITSELLQGHLKLANTLCSCERVPNESTDLGFVRFLLDDFLFCASQTVANNQSLVVNALDLNFNYADTKCRQEAFNLLLTLARNERNLQEIAGDLCKRHHATINSQEWNFQPAVSGRPNNGFVGLKNAGATCYMNSILQQLYMQPGLKEAILKLEETNSESTVFHLQTIFGHLLESQQQCYAPQSFWNSFKLWGEPVNVREQQDAFEFFTNITDQLSENLKSLKKEALLSNLFTGQFVDQKICSECSHCFERNEPFSSLPVTVKSGNLEASLEQFVCKDVMEGENAYYCEKCLQRRTTVKRTCIKTLPPVLAVQLKRFYYDWERNRAIKFDDFFSFPWTLNMEPYTKEGMTRLDSESSNGTGGKDSPASPLEQQMPPMRIVTNTRQYYELVGVVVHSGQVNAGHYYSFVKNRQSGVGESEKWYKFNDATVERFEMNDEKLRVECFGGEYRVTQNDTNNQYPENRVRNWNAYMLFYETMDKSKLPYYASSQASSSSSLGDMYSLNKVRDAESYPASPCSSTSSNPPSPGGTKSSELSVLSSLIKKGERKGLFRDNMPSAIKRMVNEENVKFMQNRDVYNSEYFTFLLNLCNKHNEFDINELTEVAMDTSLYTLQLSVQFLFNTYLRTAASFRGELESWKSCVTSSIKQNVESRMWFLQWLSSEKGRTYIVMYLIECPEAAIREFFSTLLSSACESHYSDSKSSFELDALLDQLLSLLEEKVSPFIKQASQYFAFFNKYAYMNEVALRHLAEKQCLSRFFHFLVGSNVNENKFYRRWNVSDSREMMSIHYTNILIVLNTDVSPQRTDITTKDCPLPESVELNVDPLQLHHCVEELLFGNNQHRFLNECIFASLEFTQVSSVVIDMLVHVCWCNINYSLLFIRQIQDLLSEYALNDFKAVFQLVTAVLDIADNLQEKRVEYFIEGSKAFNIPGALGLIRACHQDDAQRAYQCIKYLVRSPQPMVRTFLHAHASRWQWTVDWLKKKMNEHSYWSGNSSNDNFSSFQRTTSAQNTLAEATKLLSEIDSQQQQHEQQQQKKRAPGVIKENEIS